MIQVKAISEDRLDEIAAEIVFAAVWDAESHPAFLEKNGWRVREKAVLEASIPLVYAECEAT